MAAEGADEQRPTDVRREPAAPARGEAGLVGAETGAGLSEILDAVFPNRAAISSYVDILTSRGVEWGLIGPREPERIWDRHILNSVAVAELIPAAASVVDVGSGAGLPGIPLALARPDLRITLLEPLLRRSNFLELAVTELGVGERVKVVRGRAEDWPAAATKFDIVTGRAVAPLAKFVGWTDRLRSRAGEILALKGSSAGDELTASASMLRQAGLVGEVLEVRAHRDCEPTMIVRVRGQQPEVDRGGKRGGDGGRPGARGRGRPRPGS